MAWLLSKRAIEKLRRISSWIDNFEGDGVSNAPENATVTSRSFQDFVQSGSPPIAEVVWVKITEASLSAVSNQWEYTGIEQRRIDGGWKQPANARTFTGIRNSIEAENDGTGTEGGTGTIEMGVDTDGATISLEAFGGGGPRVRMWIETDYRGGKKLYTIQVPNPLGVACG